MYFKILKIILIPLKLFLIYFISQQAFKILLGEDIYYLNRKTNTYCQNSQNQVDRIICEKEKFKKFMFLYIDSVPFDLFAFHNKFLDNHSTHFILKHLGITDSGPVFSNLITGKVANKYEGSVANVDNIFLQFKQAGFKIQGFGYEYPIEQMLGHSFFESYQNIFNGLHGALCEDFIDLHEVNIEGINFVKDSLIFSNEELYRKFSEHITHFKKILKEKKESLNSCLKKKVSEINSSYFIYNVYTDVIGHQFSRQSEFYIKKIAALKANLEFLLQFFQDFEKDNLLIIISDHGVVSSLWESEISNHGIPENGNESFIFVYNQSLNPNLLNKPELVNSYLIPTYFAQWLQNVNIPANAKGQPFVAKLTKLSEIQALRTKEMQLINYFQTFQVDELKKMNIILEEIQTKSPFKKLEKFLLKNQIEGEKVVLDYLDQYREFVNDLLNQQEKIFQNNIEQNSYQNFFIKLIILFVIIIPSLYNLFIKGNKGEKLIGIFSLFILTFLPMIFLVMSSIYEQLFSPYFLIFYSIYIFLIFNNSSIVIKQITQKLNLIYPISLILKFYDYLVSFNNFYFFYYQNPFLQTILIIIYIIFNFYCIILIFQIKSEKQFYEKKYAILLILLFILIDLSVIFYEIKLISAFDYHQDFFMTFLSWVFYMGTILILPLALNFYKDWKFIIFLGISKSVFWFGTNYLRLPFYLLILPCLIYILLKENKNAQIKELQETKIFNFTLMIFWMIFIFKTLRGEFDSNISVRIANRSLCQAIEKCTSFTAILFVMNKFLPFIVLIPFIFTLNNYENKLTNLVDKILAKMNDATYYLVDFWFGFGILIYFLSISDPIHQRSSFMLHSANIIMISISYIYMLIEIFIEKSNIINNYQGFTLNVEESKIFEQFNLIEINYLNKFSPENTVQYQFYQNQPKFFHQYLMIRQINYT